MPVITYTHFVHTVVHKRLSVLQFQTLRMETYWLPLACLGPKLVNEMDISCLKTSRMS